MKTIPILVAAMFFSVAHAETADPSESLEARTARRVQETPLRLDERQPNEIKVGKLCYSGIAVEIVKVDNPLQMINPFAPARYGSSDINVVKEAGGKASGLKFFSISF